MKIKVNGKDVTTEKEITIKELLEIEKVEMPEYVTVQVNEELIAKEDFDTFRVKDNDAVDFLYFMGGGNL